MTARYLIGMAAMPAFTAMVACSQAATPIMEPAPAVETKGSKMFEQTRVSGSYIVKAPGDGNTAIRHVFAHYGVALVRPLGNDQFELRLERDPGLDVLKRLVTGSGGAVTAIQPDFVYRSK